MKSPMLECPPVAGRHVRLEPLEVGHAAQLLTAADESRATYAFTLVPRDLVGMGAYIATALAEREQGQSIPFVVRDSRGRVAGSTRFMSIEHWDWPGEPPAPVPDGPDAVEIGCTWYAERVQRTALNTEAKLLLCSHAFERWRVRRIAWKTDAATNDRAQRSCGSVRDSTASFARIAPQRTTRCDRLCSSRCSRTSGPRRNADSSNASRAAAARSRACAD